MISIQWQSFKTIFRKEVVRFLRIWPQTLLPSLITAALYYLIFGDLIGSRLTNIGGVKYIDLIAPGLIMMAVITNSYSNVVSSFFYGKFLKNLEEIIVSPTSSLVIVCGYVCGGALRGLIAGLLVALMSLFFTTLTIHNIFIVLAYAFLAAVVFALAGLLNGIYAKKFDDVALVPTFVLTPLIYLGGVFYPITLLFRKFGKQYPSLTLYCTWLQDLDMVS